MRKCTTKYIGIALIAGCLMHQKTDNFPFIPLSFALISIGIATWYTAKRYEISWKDFLDRSKQLFVKQNTVNITINNQINMTKIIEYKNEDKFISDDFLNLTNNKTLKIKETSNNETEEKLSGSEHSFYVESDEKKYDDFFDNNSDKEDDTDQIDDDELLSYEDSQDKTTDEDKQEEYLKQIDQDNVKKQKKDVENNKIKTEIIKQFCNLMESICFGKKQFLIKKEAVENFKSLHHKYPHLFRQTINGNDFALVVEALRPVLTPDIEKTMIQSALHACLPYKIAQKSFDKIYLQLMAKKKK